MLLATNTFVPSSGATINTKHKVILITKTNNNIGEARVRVPDRVGRTGFGPGGGKYAESETMEKKAVKY